MRQILSIILIICAGINASAQAKYVRYKLSFPHVSLKNDLGERIYSVQVVMHCGRFVAINSIPDDWSATLVRPISEETRLEMEAGHGTSALWHSEDLNKFITVLVVEPSCFDIAASMAAASYYDGKEHEREVSFKQNELILRRESSTRSASTVR
jgi:hypothetical protein